ncbi:MAG: histidine--tRNA ligase [Nitrospinota bacterium]
MQKENLIVSKVKGVNDIFAPNIYLWQEVEQTAASLFELYNYSEIRTPTFEKSQLFNRSIGEGSDIVEKELYSFKDRGDQLLALRPEGTASVARAVIEQKLLSLQQPLKLFYHGSMFRAERPQANRFREFHQIGAECFGMATPLAEVELILILVEFLNRINLKSFTLLLNSLGCNKCREPYKVALAKYLESVKDALCESCQARMQKNVLRTLDCKKSSCKTVLADGPLIDKYRCLECESDFEFITSSLSNFNIDFTVDPKLVRGLDYYNKTAFEVVSDQLGSQDALAGGGRYDLLVEQLGGTPTEAVGFAIGLERVISILLEQRSDELKLTSAAADLDLVILIFVKEAGELGLKIGQLAIAANYRRTIIEVTGKSMKSIMRSANKSNAKVAILIGSDELTQNKVTIKNMRSGEQDLISFDKIQDRLATFLSK